MKEGIDLDSVAQKYNETNVIWNEADMWHMRSKNSIEQFIYSSLAFALNSQDLEILNAGSAGYSYGLNEDQIIHIDIAHERITHLQNSIVADIHKIPLEDERFDMVICVGSVINYCDPIVAIKELSRVLTKNGYLILEFENSHTFELVGRSEFNKKAILVNTFYNGRSEKIWYFSESYIREICSLCGLEVISLKRWHILSSLVYRITKSENYAAKFSSIDSLLSKIPILKKFSSNTIFLLKKKEL